MIARFGAARDPRRRYRLRRGVYAVLIRDGRVLLTHQAAPIPEVQLPGGGVDPGEGALPALHREVWEETGWSIAAPRRLGAFRRFTYMPEYDLWAEKLCEIYLARPVRRLGPVPEAGHTALWLPPDVALARLAGDGDRHFLARALDQV
ncbi:NUDIX domain-containing protein [Rhodobaculum claviforme]|uniref:NUDIX hydrolase n=1 Tax=Rhodobaculum claviforme TaxID=1549854 RepID=A0A934WEM3_9RHOB|nr:NUDIX hydrolase [Rhodobaculum claviforme]MBK5926265.1 NUDIX hydrolase [Rhodobaculum claviforme]